ncbi:hypothetical protein [Roseibium sp. RKSG952]|uniref:hypothetical protein n=1 Tax=Roseibium sp. RKSG952 TaxID=2529384 RepID=UPI0012BB4A92|nr:hypothetical protein [Roseibium sp. RKSG952]MTH96705.1 hypothetical protein [Roseibium sp. RKSG952]
MADDIAHNPFLNWYAGLVKIGGISSHKKENLLLSDIGGRRFSIGVHDGKPLLACLKGDVEALKGIRWSRALINIGAGGRDWIALKSKDVRRDRSEIAQGIPAPRSPWGVKGTTKQPLTLWIPVTSGRLSVWTTDEVEMPEKLCLGLMGRKKGAPHLRGAPFMEISLITKGTT